jgi:hypothetical protein
MKKRVLIIEDNDCRSFTTKQVLECTLRLNVKVVGVESGAELVAKAGRFNPDMIIYRPEGGVSALLERMQKRNTNCRNTEITMIVTSELDESVARRIHNFAAGWSRVKCAERAA